MRPGNGLLRTASRRPALLAGGCWLFSAARAHAHTTFPGLGDYASGFLHPLTTPPHLLVLLALGLWLGQQTPLRIKEPAMVFAGAAMLGLLLTASAHVAGVPAAVFSVAGLCVGAGVAAAVPVRFRVRMIACGALALVLGLDSGVDAGVPLSAAVRTLSATWASLVLCLVNVAFYVSLLPAARPAQIGVRIVGSWIVAVALLLLAFALRR